MKKHAYIYQGEFRDSVIFDPTAKTAVSVRDGILEYAGEELDEEPADKIFTVYRSPATIANTAMKMAGIPITDEHVTLDVPAPTDGGSVSDAAMIDALDTTTKTTIAIKNNLLLSDEMKATVDSGKRELSLGYKANLVPHDLYDFEQIDIVPHHLAAVDRGRCGSMCSFLDKKTEGEDMKLHKAFCDAEGKLNLQQIIELATGLPEAIKSVPVDQLAKLVPALQKVVAASSAVMPEGETIEEEMTDEKEKVTDMEEDSKEEVEVTDEETDEEDKDKKFSDAVAKQAKTFTDEAVKAHGAAIEKARRFLNDDYDFADKSTETIIRDALATETNETFIDSELPVAFKLLKSSAASYKDFADKGTDAAFEKLKEKEI
ncbi:MAG: DUF2213 domain-containing protein [Mariprofundaceae bacterium]|nr:DUF2213 domain-containing protein [Methylophaga sp.]MBL4759635.1 DUF2213 domain-containing protein [Mariprofundaceae bacterium]